MGYDKLISASSFTSSAGFDSRLLPAGGRAGRGISHAVGALLSGHEDQKIHAFFRRAAFPTERQIKTVLNALSGLKA